MPADLATPHRPVPPSWRRRGAYAVILAVAAVGLFAGCATTGPAHHGAAPTASASSEASFNADAPGAPTSAPAISASPTVAENGASAANTTALALLATLPIKPPQVGGGYQRTVDFGEAWLDVDHNGCDTRDDILARDLTDITKSGPCTVLTGTLVSPYTGATIHFQRGEATSALVQIDHLVPLGDAWRTGAQALTLTRRETLANDPLELLALDGKSNDQKGEKDAASWLPPEASFDCTYVARQVSVKAAYGLWVTQAEHDAMARVLHTCPWVDGTASQFAPAADPVAVVAPTTPVAPAAPPAPAPVPAGVVHPGAYCSTAGATGVTSRGTAMVCDATATDSRLRWRSH